MLTVPTFCVEKLRPEKWQSQFLRLCCWMGDPRAALPHLS